MGRPLRPPLRLCVARARKDRAMMMLLTLRFSRNDGFDESGPASSAALLRVRTHVHPSAWK
jgi:hypothetical protein